MHGWLGWVVGWIGSGIKKTAGKIYTTWEIDMEQSLEGGVLLMRKAESDLRVAKGKRANETGWNALDGV